jgi:hypothetical protein
MTDFELTPYQKPTVERMLEQKRHGVAFRMGLGKTVVGVYALWELRPRIVVIICHRRNAIPTWIDHISQWFPGLDKKYGRKTRVRIHAWLKKQSNQSGRRALWQAYDPDVMNVYITTAATFIADTEYFHSMAQVVIYDEAKGMRSRKSKIFAALKSFLRKDAYFWPMTGTPGYLPEHFWTMFHLFDPHYFRSFWALTTAFLYTQKTPFGGIEILGWKNKPEWDRLLKSKFTFVSKADAQDTPLRRQMIHVEMDDVQTRLYRSLESDMLAIGADHLVVARTSLDLTTKLRQLLVCPKIVDPGCPSYGAALEDLIELLTDGETSPHVVIFTPFTAAFPYFRERLNSAGFNDVYQLQGGLTPDEQAAAIDGFRRTRGQMLCSIMYAQSFSLEPATEAFFIGYEFDPDDNEQAEYRIKRLTTKAAINVYYYAYDDTYDARMCEIVNIKRQQANMTIDMGKVGLKF